MNIVLTAKQLSLLQQILRNTSEERSYLSVAESLGLCLDENGEWLPDAIVDTNDTFEEILDLFTT